MEIYKVNLTVHVFWRWKTKMAAARTSSDPFKNPSDMLNMTSSSIYISNIKVISQTVRENQALENRPKTGLFGTKMASRQPSWIWSTQFSLHGCIYGGCIFNQNIKPFDESLCKTSLKNFKNLQNRLIFANKDGRHSAILNRIDLIFDVHMYLG